MQRRWVVRRARLGEDDTPYLLGQLGCSLGWFSCGMISQDGDRGNIGAGALAVEVCGRIKQVGRRPPGKPPVEKA